MIKVQEFHILILNNCNNLILKFSLKLCNLKKKCNNSQDFPVQIQYFHKWIVFILTFDDSEFCTRIVAGLVFSYLEALGSAWLCVKERSCTSSWRGTSRAERGPPSSLGFRLRTICTLARTHAVILNMNLKIYDNFQRI